MLPKRDILIAVVQNLDEPADNRLGGGQPQRLHLKALVGGIVQRPTGGQHNFAIPGLQGLFVGKGFAINRDNLKPVNVAAFVIGSWAREGGTPCLHDN